MIGKIKKYITDHKKNLYYRFLILTLVLLIIGLSYVNFILVKKMVADLISEEKAFHAQEICITLNEIGQETNSFTQWMGQLKNQRNYLDKEQKKEIIQDLRKLEGQVRKIDIAYFAFYNDLSLKFFSWNKNTPEDNLFSQIKNLPVYGYRAIESTENVLNSDYVTKNQVDFLQIEFGELQEKIKSIYAVDGFCSTSFQ